MLRNAATKLASSAAFKARHSIVSLASPASTRSLWGGNTYRPAQDKEISTMDNIATPKFAPLTSTKLNPISNSSNSSKTTFQPTAARHSPLFRTATVTINPVDPTMARALTSPSICGVNQNYLLTDIRGRLINHDWRNAKSAPVDEETTLAVEKSKPAISTTRCSYNYPLTTCNRGLLSSHFWHQGRLAQTRGFWTPPCDSEDGVSTAAPATEAGNVKGKRGATAPASLYAVPMLAVLGGLTLYDMHRTRRKAGPPSNSA